MKNVLLTIISCALAGMLLAMGITQEVPVGGLEGKVTMRENGRPLAHVLVVVTPAVEKAGEVGKDWHARTHQDGTFTLPEVPSGEYTISADAHEHTLSQKQVTVVEARRTDVEIKLEPNDPNLETTAARTVYAPGEPIDLNVHGFVPQSSLKVSVYRLKLSAVSAAGGLEQALQPLSRYNADVNPRTVGVVESSTDYRIEKKDLEGAFTQQLHLPGLSEGLYFLSTEAGKQSQRVFLNVTKLALVTKTCPGSALAYVTDIDTGLPVSEAAIMEFKNGAFAKVAATNGSGLARISIPAGSGQRVLLAKSGRSIAAVGFDQGSDEGGDDDRPDPNVKIFTYAERPVYRPGDTVRFKSIVRKLIGEELHTVPMKNAKVRFLNEQEDLLETKVLPISAHGTLDGSFSTSAEEPPGVYQIEVNAGGGKDTYYVNFAAYRKPDYSVKVTPTKLRYATGDTASATVDCQYYFGGPVVGAKVTATIYRSPAWEAFGESIDDSDDDSTASDDSDFTGGEYVEDVTATTDGAGRAVIQFATSSEDPKNGDDQYDYHYSIQASVSESDERSFEGSGSVLVTRGGFRLSATTDPYIATVGTKANLTISTESFDKSPSPVPNRTVQVEIGRVTWLSHAEVFEPMQHLVVTTNSNGKAVVPLDVSEPQNLLIKVSTLDDQGRTIKDRTDLYVDGSSAFDESPKPKLAVRLDRKRYNIGDTAKALIVTSSPGGMALLCVSAEKIVSSRLVALAKGSTVVAIPVTKEMSPNVWVSVAYVHTREFAEAQRNLRVSRPDHSLNVSVVPDAAHTLPGATVAFRVKTSDALGHGVPANLSLGVVDESIYAIKKDTTNILASLFPERSNSVQTSYSFPEIYMDGGDKGGGAVAVRRKFLDTAAWAPEVQTNGQGLATVNVRLPDNLTSWRATVVAATDDTAVGMAASNVVASKPLMVRLLTPQFLVATDRQRISAAVSNDSGHALDVDLNIKADGIGVGDAAPRRVHLENGQTSDLPLDLQAQSSGTGVLVAEVKSDDGVSDAVEGKFPILPHGRLVVDRKAGPVNSEAQVDLSLLPTHDPNSGRLDLVITPGVASAMVQSLDELVQFPYGCVEQTMSRFLPALLVTHTIATTPLKRPDLQTKAAAIAKDGFQRLAKMQHTDGAWGWWTYDDSDPFMTAWVLDGLKRAENAGYDSPPNLDPDKALAWAKARLAKPFKNDSTESRMYLTYALAEYGNLDTARAVLMATHLAQQGPGVLALAALTADAVREKDLRDQILKRLSGMIDENESRSAEERFWDPGEQSALELLALTELRPKDQRIPELVNRLMSERRADGWESTRETSLVIAGLCKFLASNPEAIKPSEVSVKLNGTEVRTLRISPTEVDATALHIKIPVAKLSPGENKLMISTSGGQPFYSVNLTQYDVEPKLGQILEATGVDVSRRYLKMAPQRMEDGTLKLMPSAEPIDHAQPGDVIRCELTVHAARNLSYMLVEDPIPSNCRVTDREDPAEGEDWSYWWSAITILDDRVSLFARDMPKGDHKLTYTMRVEGAGTSSALPTHVEDMYHPETEASGGENILEVER